MKKKREKTQEEKKRGRIEMKIRPGRFRLSLLDCDAV
jgi:hypothetical protein